MPPLERIISGGQTGVDQGALEAAKMLGIATGGWMPSGVAGSRATHTSGTTGGPENPMLDWPRRCARRRADHGTAHVHDNRRDVLTRPRVGTPRRLFASWRENDPEWPECPSGLAVIYVRREASC